MIGNPEVKVSMSHVRLLELRNTYKWGGGPDKTILLSAARHDPSRVSVIVAYVRDANDHEFKIAEKAHALGLTFYEIEERSKFDLRVLRSIRDIILKHDINLIHAHDYKSDLFAYLVGLRLRRRRMALLSTAHAWVMLGLRGRLYRRLDLLLMRRFTHLIAVSQATKDEMTTAGVPAAMVSVIHNAIETDIWSPTSVSTNLRKELGLGNAFPIIGYVGRIMPEKDLDTWLHAAALVAKKFPDAAFVLVGEGRDGRTLQYLRDLATSLGISKRVIFPGYQENLPPFYHSFDIFFMSSRREGLPNSILEAMALGLPVVTTDVAGTKELVINGETGFVLAQQNVYGLAQALTTLANDHDMRSRMGLASRRRVEREFSFAGRLQRIETVYEQLVRGQPAVSSSPCAAIPL
jgi:glycosyltransferase involved in cell wall biosynthesis